MDAVGGSNTFAGRHVLTKLTLSLLEDTGWYGPRLFFLMLCFVSRILSVDHQGASVCRYTVFYSTAGFNAWGYHGGCEFAYEACSGPQPDSSFFCNAESNTADELCTSDRSSTGLCQTDSRATYDGCSKVKEYSNGGCTGPSISRPPATSNINGWYKGPFSRCIQESPGFGRNGYQYTDKTQVNAQCYEMVCMAGQLWVVVDQQQLLCPSGGYLEFDTYPGKLPHWLGVLSSPVAVDYVCVKRGNVLLTKKPANWIVNCCRLRLRTGCHAWALPHHSRLLWHWRK